MSIAKAEQLMANRDFAGARKFLRSQLLRKNKINKDVMYLLSLAEAELGNVGEALDILSRIIIINAHHAAAHYTKAYLLANLNRHLDALPHHDRAVELLASNPWAFINRGISRAALENYAGAIDDFGMAIALDPTLSAAFGNKGTALLEMQLLEQSLQFLDEAIELDPSNINALSGKSACLSKLKHSEEALVFSARAIELKPDFAEAWSNRAIALNDLKRHEEALTSYDRAIELKPDFAEAWSNRAIALNDLKRHEEALTSYDRAIELKPDADYVLGSLVHTQMKICDWTDLDSRCRTLESRLLTGDLANDPLQNLGLFDDPLLQQQCASLYAKNKLGFTSPLGPIGKRVGKDKIRVGYFSMDFRDHAVAHLVANLIEYHDREKFEIYGVSFGVNTGDVMRRRLEGAFDKFYDVRHLSEIDIARLSRELEIDIAVDLGGYTQESRPAIFAHRAAPVQINYLGFPGTMGTPLMDYLIADSVVIPADSQGAYSEKIIYLPNSYQVNDSKRLISDRVFTRREVDLPESDFIFCCFNSTWKIAPETLDTWVRIIQSVPNSILWLLEDNPAAKRNLMAAASKRGLGANRLVFAKRLPNAEHLARYRLADLFLDTFPYGAHTTASDALWAGLPVLTRPGKSFASRVASSLLRSVGLPELVTHSIKEYESLAIEIANSSGEIARLKARLTANRHTCPLFNTRLFTRHIESAYRAVHDRLNGGLAPDHIYVTA